MADRSKLLLPWPGRSAGTTGTVIERVLETWTKAGLTSVLLVVRKDDHPLLEVAASWPSVDLIVPDVDPPDMRASIALGLQRIREVHAPSDRDRWLVSPADLPTLFRTHIQAIVSASQNDARIWIPRFGGKKGHPVSVPWSMASAVAGLPRDRGIDALLATHPHEFLDLPAELLPQDIDTPEDYEKLLRRWEELAAAMDAEPREI
jgi:molybdenum cofactor cytidylyltransferase